MKLKLIGICLLSVIAAAGCKSNDLAKTDKKAESNTQVELCERNTGSRLKKKC